MIYDETNSSTGQRWAWLRSQQSSLACLNKEKSSNKKEKQNKHSTNEMKLSCYCNDEITQSHRYLVLLDSLYHYVVP